MRSCSKALLNMELALVSILWRNISLVLVVILVYPKETFVKSMRARRSSMCCSLSTSMSWMFNTKSFHPFIMHFFACKADIFLIENFLYMPWIFTWFPWLSVQNIDLCKQSSMTWCCSNQSMAISTSYDPKGKMFKFILARKKSKFTSQSLTISETFHFLPVANCTSYGFACLTFSSLHVSTIWCGT